VAAADFPLMPRNISERSVQGPGKNETVTEGPETRYATTDDGLHIAYQVTGEGSVNLIELGGGANFSIQETVLQPRWRHYEERLASFSRLLRFDFRGVGLSDPFSPSAPPASESYVKDAVAVLDAEGIEDACLLGVTQGGIASILLAATHPQRVRGLVLVNAYARLIRDDDYPVGLPSKVLERFGDAVVDPADSSADDLHLSVPSLASDPEFAEWWRAAGHRGASPSIARALWRSAAGDVRSVLDAVRVPTLILHTKQNDFVRVGHGRYLAEHIANARFVELPGADNLPWAIEADVTGEIEEFLTGTRHPTPTNRVLSTILFTDIVESTRLAAEMGDRRWRERLDLYEKAVERQLARFGGVLIKSTGDGSLARFDAPAQCVRCALAIRDTVRPLGLEIRAGLHTGEIEVRGSDIGGIAVHIAARITALARPGEVVVSRTICDLVAGSGIEFDDRGEHELKGLPGTWRLYTVSP
jgi:class 3 adenylate cyclase